MNKKGSDFSSGREVCKCERCGRFRDLFQYTHWEADRWVDFKKDNGAGANPRFSVETRNLAERRGLCEECAVVVNTRQYDTCKYSPKTPADWSCGKCRAWLCTFCGYYLNGERLCNECYFAPEKEATQKATPPGGANRED